MNAQKLVSLVEEIPEFRDVVAALESRKNLQVAGLTAAAKSLLISAIRKSFIRTLVVVTYNYEQAERLYEDLEELGVEDIVLVPPSDSMVYQESETDMDIVSRRLTALCRLADGSLSVVVLPISAVLQRTIGPEVLARCRMRIEKGCELDLGKSVRRLVDLGYKRVNLVEQQGEFSQRGGILDVFPSTEDRPIRIELFGDEVESIRSFDVESQRSVAHLDRVDIAPAREILLDENFVQQASSTLRELLASKADELERVSGPESAGRLRERVENDIVRMSNLEYFDGLEYYFPVLYPEEFSLLDYVPRDAVVILDEPHQISSQWKRLHEELMSALRARVLKGDVLELPADHVMGLKEAIERLKRNAVTVVFSTLGRQWEYLRTGKEVAFESSPIDVFGGQMGILAEQLETWTRNGCRVILVTNQRQRVTELLEEYGVGMGRLSDNGWVDVIDGRLRSGFKLPQARLMVLTDREIFGISKLRRPRKAFRKGLALSSVLELQEGDYVVHIDHGIGRYRGLRKLAKPGGGEQEYLLIEYAGVDKLYVPVEQVDRVQKYIGAEGMTPALHKLGGTEWARTTRRVKQSVMEMAKELLELYAARRALQGYSFSPDTTWQQEMESAFEYEETPDQLRVIQEVKEDLEEAKPMDRLVCGDVGYGKTEIAIRAVFKVVNDGKQAVVLAPTTVLAQQHFNTFSERLAAYPVRIAMLSRFKSRPEQKKIIEGLRTGEIDIVIGTHRLFSKDIQFRDLGLVVVDEEQRFGVAHKERLKHMKKTVDVLTLTATPIPRTLHMSLSGIRDMSLINDAPEGRLSIKTYAEEYNDETVRDAILRELDRDGQVYFVHNRVENIELVADHLRQLVPCARIEVGHGQMAEEELERVMLDFYEHKFDVLVCTTIIESGIDIPNVNTIIIDECEKLGLAQLYQLRGRVGRSNRQAYAYLMYKSGGRMTETAEKRIEAIKEFSDLGSGFRIAVRDLEIRGAGNLLGPEQHGQMVAVGLEMYCRLLGEAIQEIKGDEVETFTLPPVDLPVDAYIPMSYVHTEETRLSFYKRITSARDEEEVETIGEELRDRFGDLPKPVRNSLGIMALRLKAARASVRGVTTSEESVVIKFAPGVKLAADVADILRGRFPGCVFQPDKVIVHRNSPRLIKLLGQILDELPEALEESKAVYLGLFN